MQVVQAQEHPVATRTASSLTSTNHLRRAFQALVLFSLHSVWASSDPISVPTVSPAPARTLNLIYQTIATPAACTNPLLVLTNATDLPSQAALGGWAVVGDRLPLRTCAMVLLGIGSALGIFLGDTAPATAANTSVVATAAASPVVGDVLGLCAGMGFAAQAGGAPDPFTPHRECEMS